MGAAMVAFMACFFFCVRNVEARSRHVLDVLSFTMRIMQKHRHTPLRRVMSIRRWAEVKLKSVRSEIQ